MALYRNEVTAILPGGVDTVVIGANLRRVSLIISRAGTIGAGLVMISFGSPASATGAFLIPASDKPLVVTADHYGQAVQDEIHAFATLVNRDITIVEIFTG